MQHEHARDARELNALAALRPYQVRAVSSLREHVRAGNRRVLLVLPTGGGKTLIATEIAKRHVATGGRVLVLAHRAELIRQTADAFRGEPVRVIQAARSGGPADARIVVASIPTLAARPDSLPPATLVIFDEAHHTRAKSWERIASAYRDAILIGLTATPQRADGKPLGDLFNAITVVSTVRELTDMGYLVPCSVFAPEEFSDALAADPADAYLEHGNGRKGIIFCATVEHARATADRLVAAGVPAACVDGHLAPSVRRAYLDSYAAGTIRVVTNCAVLTEGFNDPGAEVCILARACDHIGLYLQIVGRILRPAPGKDSATLIDLRGVARRHGLPDDPREYSLDGDPIRTVDALPALKQCLRCGYCGRAWRACPACENEQSDPKPIEVRRAELKQVFASDGEDLRRAYFDRLTATARERGYAPGWVAHRYRAKYGAWPVMGRGAA